MAGGFLGAGYGPGFGLVSRDGRARAGAERRSWCLLDHPESPGWRLGQAFQRESAVTEGPAAQDALPCPAPRTQKPPSPWDGRTASRARLWLQPGTASCRAGCGAVGRTGSCEPRTTLVRCLQQSRGFRGREGCSARAYESPLDPKNSPLGSSYGPQTNAPSR